MDELLNDFLVETAEHIDAAGIQLVLFENNPDDKTIIASIFRLLHTIKGTCGFLGLSRLELLTHAAEALVSRLREGVPGTAEIVSVILAAVDRIKFILQELENTGCEPAGEDTDLITALELRVASSYSAERPPQTFFANEINVTSTFPTGDEPSGSISAPSVESAPTVQSAPIQRSIGQREPKAQSLPGTQGGTGGAASHRAETIRVSVDMLERIMLLVSELVLTRNQLLDLNRRREDETIKAPLQRLSGLTTDLQDMVMRARMQPMRRLFSTLPRLMRDLSIELGKKFNLVTDGGDTELDRQLIELIRDPLTHLLRNCADHGIESAEERAAAGKPEAGTITVIAAHQAGYITIDVKDDGRGLNLARIRAKALERGLATQAELNAMPDDEVCRFIFVPSFSTAPALTSISGRGIGMDVVRENIEEIGGSISLRTMAGRGTHFCMKIPLTLAITPALIVQADSHRFALPQHSVVEVVGIGDGSHHEIERIRGSLILRLRNEVLPLADLKTMFGLTDHTDGLPSECRVVVMHVGIQAFGILVDTVADVQEVVVKPLGASLAHLSVFSGHTILGDGSVVLILDASGIAANLGLIQSNEYSVVPAIETAAADKGIRLVLFRAGEGSIKAVPLSLIARIEMVETNTLERCDGMFLMQHQGQLMLLMPICRMELGKEHPALVLGVGGENMGLLVEEILDIVEERLDVEVASTTPGIIGSARIRDMIVELIDVAHFMRIGRPHAFARCFAKRFQVLLVDDKPFFRDMLSPVLTAAGYDVTTAGSGQEALSLFDRARTFDVVITDIDMPDMSGYALAHTLIHDRKLSQLPILALAAHAAPAIEHAAAASGMRGVIGKFDRMALLQALNELLDSKNLGTHDLEAQVMGGLAA